MRRRTLLRGLLGSAGAGAVAACASPAADTATTATPTTATPTPSGAGSRLPSATAAAPTPASSAAPVLASTKSSSLGPRPVEARYVPVPGAAPARTYPVGWRILPFSRGPRPLPTTVWYPATAAGDDTAVAFGRFPALVFSHGLDATPDMYASIAARFVRAGIVVAAPRYPHTARGVAEYQPADLVNQPADASSVLDQLLSRSPLARSVDPARLGAGGHSGGGITTSGLFSSHRDRRLKAGVILAGTDFQAQPFAGPAAAMLFVHGTDDDTVSWRAGHTVFEAVPWSRAFLSIDGGGHSLDSRDFDVATGTATEFLRWSLFGDAAAKARIPSAATVDGIATLTDQL
jgi:dienelactone hydrolase